MPKPRVLHDEFFKKAKEDGYVARSAYKLLEINERLHIVRRDAYVIDLGCSPGSWLQVLDGYLNTKGRAVGIDLQPTTAPLSDRVYIMQGDIFATPAKQLLAPINELLHGDGNSHDKYDAVISDMAPNTSGHGDDFLSARLCERVLDLCHDLLRPGGNMVMKILEGSPTPDVIARTKQLFREGGTTKPRASRDVSREIFIWGKGFTGVELPKPPNPTKITGPTPKPKVWP
ncbi:MAG TPA: RlmE family RNA methyltransferase [Phycisphaerales bacterium]|nr:RlmE family RNA methyltransferase [Phycisphaerales bacterium]